MDKTKIKNKINSFVSSKNFKIAIYILFAVFALSFVFRVGMMVGYQRASFGRDWGNNYERNFGGGRRPPFIKDNMMEMPNAHGAIGKIIKVELPNIVVLDKDQTEKVVIIKDDSIILERKDKISKENLTNDKYIVVIGNPNESGQIEAKLIRVIPSPDEMGSREVSRFNTIMRPEINNKNI